MIIKNKKISRTGFTLVEIVMALAILVVGLLSLLALFPVGLTASARSANESEAAILGRMQLESILQIYQIYFSDLTEDNLQCVNDTDRLAFSVNSRYSWRAGVSTVISGYLKRVNLSVYWTDKGQEQEMVFNTYVGNYE